uniref:Hydroxyacylglutathione hydrolase n=1 Tax=Erwinia amylovora ATCC BAA-2158 TaxID=889211 RepID=E5B2I9_ERWAM|nr:probable hydroxyacylglutathione hydrolase [Erwinia amylovora ATCC BAA-2158]
MGYCTAFRINFSTEPANLQQVVTKNFTQAWAELMHQRIAVIFAAGYLRPGFRHKADLTCFSRLHALPSSFPSCASKEVNMNLTSIPALQDNYIWTLNDDSGRCLIVDPGEAGPVLRAIKQNHWQPQAILLTHHHYDHVGGVEELLVHHPDLIVYGPQETCDKGANNLIGDGDHIEVLGLDFTIIATPGHTLGHISYFSKPYLFCGDTLFSAGCGRLFEGTAKQMFESFQKLNELPDDTLICCAHEYTLSSLTFSHHIYPQEAEITRYYHEIKELRAKNGITLPTKLAHERIINVFLRTKDVELQRLISQDTAQLTECQTFAILREKKDSF